MKNFSPANIENYIQVQHELTQQFFKIIGATNQVESNQILKEGVKTYPGFVSEESTPNFYKFINKLPYGEIVNMTFWVTGMFTKNKPHIDGTSKFVPKVKLIIPVINCEDTITKWFDYSGEIDLITYKNLELFKPIDENLLVETDSIEMTYPIWARVDKVHAILNPHMRARVACSIIFKDQDLLESVI
jgi:hypothetical protein